MHKDAFCASCISQNRSYMRIEGMKNINDETNRFDDETKKEVEIWDVLLALI